MNRLLANHHRLWIKIGAVILISMMAFHLAPPQPVQAAAVLRVSPQGSSTSGCGGAWSSTCSLIYALQIAQSGDVIWVQTGTYTPGASRNSSFRLVSGVQIYGGFAGTETLLEQRNWQANPTALSGNIGDPGLVTDNVYHVVTSNGVSSSAVLDGFTIQDGYADGASPLNQGGGIYLINSSPTLTRLIVTHNQAQDGGGMYASGSNYQLSESTILRNRADSGAGIYNDGSSAPSLINDRFYGNIATGSGGAMYNNGAAPDMSNAVMAGNQAVSSGGLFNTNNSTPILRNATLVGNQGGAFYTYATQSPANATIVNSIAWNNGPSPYYINDSTPTIRRSLLENGCPVYAYCSYVLSGDPYFVRLPAPGPDGEWGTADDDYGDLTLLSSSPVIDAGDNSAVLVSSDAGGNPRLVDVPSVPDTGLGTPPLVDFGAFEYQLLASFITIQSTSPSPSFVGQNVTISYAVTGNGGNPTGLVTVTDGTNSCTGSVAVGSCELTFITSGDKVLTASYSGDLVFRPSQSAPVTQHVDKAGTQISLVISPEPSSLGQPVHVTFSVKPPGAGQPTGQVMVSASLNSNTIACFASVAQGNCDLVLDPAGSYTMVAFYFGDSNFNFSMSPILIHQVNPQIYTTTNIVSISPEPSIVGQPVTIQFEMTAYQGTPSGLVTVTDGTSQCQALVSVGSCQISFPAAGDVALVAKYNGNSQYAASSSTSRPHTINPAETQIDLAVTPAGSSQPGKPIHITYSLQVIAPGSGSPSGKVEISDGSQTWTLDVSQTSLDITLSELGNYSFTAHYNGDGNYLPSTSNSVSHLIGLPTYLPLIER